MLTRLIALLARTIAGLLIGVALGACAASGPASSPEQLHNAWLEGFKTGDKHALLGLIDRQAMAFPEAQLQISLSKSRELNDNTRNPRWFGSLQQHTTQSMTRDQFVLTLDRFDFAPGSEDRRKPATCLVSKYAQIDKTWRVVAWHYAYQAGELVCQPGSSMARGL